jgi:hypothetical protein
MSKVLTLKARRGLDLMAWIGRGRKARFWESWAAYDQLVLEIPRNGGWSPAQAIISFDDARRLRDFIDEMLRKPSDGPRDEPHFHHGNPCWVSNCPLPMSRGHS